MYHSRATVSDCLAILALPNETREEVVSTLDAQEEESRQENYTYRGCGHVKCKGRLHTLRQMRFNICGECLDKNGLRIPSKEEEESEKKGVWSEWWAERKKSRVES